MAAATRTRKVVAKNTTTDEKPVTKNRFPGTCVECGAKVEKEAGKLAGKVKGKWTVAHLPGECQKSESASDAGATVDAPVSKFENTSGKRKNTMAAAKKTTARRTTAKRAATKPTAPTKPTARKGAAAPAKKRTTRKATEPTAPAQEVTESASDEPESNEVSDALRGLAEGLVSQIENGVLDEVLVMIDDAITNRIDAVESAKKPAPRSRKTTTTNASKGAKLAPVSRSKGSASASTTKPQGGPVRPRKGYDYVIGGASKLAGVVVKFKSYKPETDNKKASVELIEEFGGKPAGSRLVIATSALRKIEG